MSERREFFEVSLDFEQLDAHAQSNDATMRWAAAIELGQLGTTEAIKLLSHLTNDLDEDVRDAATLSLQQCDSALVSQVLADLWSPAATNQEDHDNEVSTYVAWKVRPLEVPSKQNNWITDAAVLNIVQVEAPIAGSRLLRLFGSAVYPNAPKKLPKSRIQSALARLESRGVIAIDRSANLESMDHWVISISGKSDVVIRTRGPRKLAEIPVSEVIGYLNHIVGIEFEFSSSDERVANLLEAYQIKKAELHILGEVLADEWMPLLS